MEHNEIATKNNISNPRLLIIMMRVIQNCKILIYSETALRENLYRCSKKECYNFHYIVNLQKIISDVCNNRYHYQQYNRY